MPRGAEFDTLETLHHVMAGGIEGRTIVDDETDCLVTGSTISLLE